MNTILITGGMGFIGSNFIKYILDKYKDVRIINIDKLTYAAQKTNLLNVEDHPNYTFIKGDICDQSLLINIFEKFNINGVIHFAAESHVDNSINNPTPFIETNILGTYTLLNVSRKFWMSDIGIYKPNFMNARFHHISTDEVYGTLGNEGFFSEDSNYAPNSPYSASKASSDMLVRSYYHTYGMNVVTTNCSNNYGPNQHVEKFIPTIIRKALALEEIPIYGNGKNIRDWLFVMDHCLAIEQVFLKGKSGETYLIGGHNEKKNIDVALEICDILDEIKPIEKIKSNINSYKQLIKFVNDRPGHDYRYAINDQKLRNELKFKNQVNFKMGLEITINHYLDIFDNNAL